MYSFVVILVVVTLYVVIIIVGVVVVIAFVVIGFVVAFVVVVVVVVAVVVVFVFVALLLLLSLFLLFFVCLLVTSDHQTFCSLLKVRRRIIGCINNKILIGLCSELLMRLFYCTHPGYGKKFLFAYGLFFTQVSLVMGHKQLVNYQTYNIQLALE